MTHSTRWRRVSRSEPCPVCHRPDWCLITGSPGSPSAAICPRTPSDRQVGEAGWLHVLRARSADQHRRRPTFSHTPGPRCTEELAAMAEGWRLPTDSPRLAALAQHLGVSVESLSRLGAGWSAEHTAWVFPMRSASGQVLGVRLRLRDGRKLAVRGGHEGLFIPDGLQPGDRLLVCEGPSDVGAVLDLGFNAIGRPSCTGGVGHCVALARRLRPTALVVIADADEPGQRGAERLAAKLRLYCRDIRIITPPPPHKDVRDWYRAGATAADVEQAIAAAPAWALTTTFNL